MKYFSANPHLLVLEGAWVFRLWSLASASHLLQISGICTSLETLSHTTAVEKQELTSGEVERWGLYKTRSFRLGSWGFYDDSSDQKLLTAVFGEDSRVFDHNKSHDFFL